MSARSGHGDERDLQTVVGVAANPPKDLAVGEVLGNGQWRLDSKVGQGGMGAVFSATELKLNRTVAVKALHSSALDAETVKRFEREAQVMGKLDHPNVVTLYGVGRQRGIPFLVMRFLEGGSLWDVLDANDGVLTPEQLVPLVNQLCAALGYIHGRQLLHRDLKPSNIFVSPQGKVTLLDLGLARGHESSLTRTGIIWGTPDFMAPEQILGERQLDGRADLYALAVVVYRMLANQPPFDDRDENALMKSHLIKPRPDISKVVPRLSPALGVVLQKAMAIKPEERFQTAEEFAQAFGKVATLREQATRAAPKKVETPTRREPGPDATFTGDEVDTGPSDRMEAVTGPSDVSAPPPVERTHEFPELPRDSDRLEPLTDERVPVVVSPGPGRRGTTGSELPKPSRPGLTAQRPSRPSLESPDERSELRTEVARAPLLQTPPSATVMADPPTPVVTAAVPATRRPAWQHPLVLTLVGLALLGAGVLIGHFVR